MPNNSHFVAERLEAFVPFAHGRLKQTVEDGTKYGAQVMTAIVPRKTDALAAAVESDTSVIGDGHYVGVVGVNSMLAPHALYVDRGTGVDGPFKTPVTVVGYSRTKPNRRHVMSFQKNGEERRARSSVKFKHSSNIQRGKNFSGRTYNFMLSWTHFHTGVLAEEFSAYFADINR